MILLLILLLVIVALIALIVFVCWHMLPILAVITGICMMGIFMLPAKRR